METIISILLLYFQNPTAFKEYGEWGIVGICLITLFIIWRWGEYRKDDYLRLKVEHIEAIREQTQVMRSVAEVMGSMKTLVTVIYERLPKQ